MLKNQYLSIILASIIGPLIIAFCMFRFVYKPWLSSATHKWVQGVHNADSFMRCILEEQLKYQCHLKFLDPALKNVNSTQDIKEMSNVIRSKLGQRHQYKLINYSSKTKINTDGSVDLTFYLNAKYTTDSEVLERFVLRSNERWGQVLFREVSIHSRNSEIDLYLVHGKVEKQ